MITEDEAFWAGIGVAVLMLGGGFSMLFLRAFTGFGAVVLALGLLTMAITIQMRAKPIEEEAFDAVRASLMAPTPPIASPTETAETQPSPEPSQAEAEAERTTSTEPAQPEPSEHVEPTEPTEHVEPTPPVEEPPTEPLQPPQPQAPTEEKTESPKPEEKPQEEPQVVAAAS